MRIVAKELHFPLAGVDRSLSVRDGTTPREGRVYAAPFALNVRGVDPFKQRLRGGSRPASLVVKERSLEIATTYRARRIYADGSLWFASRAGDVTDFDMGGDGEDPTRPASGNAALSGHSGETITALFTTDGQTLYMATASELWMMRGDVTDGPFSLLSPVVGCVSQDAWAWDGVKIYVLSAHGLYSFAPGEPPVCISSEIPLELQDAEWATIAYDAEYDALNVLSDVGNWTYEKENSAWWPFDSSGVSRVAIGPFRCSGRDDEDGMLDTVSATLALGGALMSVSLKVFMAKGAEEAVERAKTGTPQFTWTLGEGWAHTFRPRCRGAYCVIVLESAGAWAYESMTATVKQLGRLR